VPREGVDLIRGSTSVTETRHTGARKRERKKVSEKEERKSDRCSHDNQREVKLQKGANNDRI